MPCRIGITTNPAMRFFYWNSKYYGFDDWKILAGPFNTKAAAQKRETELAEKYGCTAYPGGADPIDLNAKWYVYGFSYTRKKD